MVLFLFMQSVHHESMSIIIYLFNVAFISVLFDLSFPSLVCFVFILNLHRNELGVAETAQKVGRPSCIPEPNVEPTVAEEKFFESAKQFFYRCEQESKSTGSRRQSAYAELIKCLHLFAAGILSKDDLIRLVKDLLLQNKNSRNGGSSSGTNGNSHLASMAKDLVLKFESVSSLPLLEYSLN